MALNNLLLTAVVMMIALSLGSAIPSSPFMVRLPVDGVEAEEASPLNVGPRDYLPNIMGYSSLPQRVWPHFYSPMMFKSTQGKRYLGIELPDYIANKGLSQLKEKMVNSGK
ncbi:uncharacterized protein [Palaemon carinicauda]|uniref:uncharacterized protein n=1 Tax=Palaemon carinicauda TaxID=392227 RepID=UPI0035B585FB